MTKRTSTRGSYGNEYREVPVTNMSIRDTGKDVVAVTGSPIQYNTPYRVRDSMGEFTEVMKPGVARDQINTADVRFLLNHSGLPMARSIAVTGAKLGTAGSLQLQDTDKALRFTAYLDTRQQLANDVLVAIENRSITQMSVGFVVGRDKWSSDYEHRDIYSFKDLVDVSGVTYPASPTTTIELLSRSNVDKSAFLAAIDTKVARLLAVADAEVRSGKAISKKNVKRLVAAKNALTSAGVAHGEAASHINDLLQMAGDYDGTQGGASGGQNSSGTTPPNGSMVDGTFGRSLTDEEWLKRERKRVNRKRDRQIDEMLRQVNEERRRMQYDVTT